MNSTDRSAIHVLLLGARGAVGTVVRQELEARGHRVTAASRSEQTGVRVDLHGDLAPLTDRVRDFDVVVNASGVERPELAAVVAGVPLVEISATGAYLDALRTAATGPLVLGAGLAPGLSTVLAAGLHSRPGDEVDVFVMLGSGERHGPAAVDWTAGLVGADVHRPVEGGRVRNLLTSTSAMGPDGRSRRYLRADFPDQVLLAGRGIGVRSWLTLSSAMMTASLGLIGRLPALRGVLTAAPHVGTDAWHVVVLNRRTGERLHAEGRGQSAATGRLTALAAERIATADARPSAAAPAPVTMADLVSIDEAIATGRG